MWCVANNQCHLKADMVANRPLVECCKMMHMLHYFAIVCIILRHFVIPKEQEAERSTVSYQGISKHTNFFACFAIPSRLLR